MRIEGITPILNVSDVLESFAWFEKLGWKRGFVDGDPPGFGAVCNEKCEIFLCKDGQGARGGTEPLHPGDDSTGATWMTWWLKTPADVDTMHMLALAHGMNVTWPPTNEPWGVREFHLRHPDGHTFRVSSGLTAA
jgi:hypothetical protein